MMIEQKLTEVLSKLDEVNYRLRRRFQKCKLKEVIHVNCTDNKKQN
jgi:hypothetical protein